MISDFTQNRLIWKGFFVRSCFVEILFELAFCYLVSTKSGKAYRRATDLINSCILSLLIIMNMRQTRMAANPLSFDQDFDNGFQGQDRELYIKQRASGAVLDINRLYANWYNAENKRIASMPSEETKTVPHVDETAREYAHKRMTHILNSLNVIAAKLRLRSMPQDLAAKITRPLEVLKTQLESSLETMDWIWTLEHGSRLDGQFTEMLTTVNELERRIDGVINIPPSGWCGSSANYKSAFNSLAVACDKFMYTADLFACLFALKPLAPAEIIVTKKLKEVIPMNLENTRVQLTTYLEDLMKSIPEVVRTVEIPIITVAEGQKNSALPNQDSKPKLDSFIMALNFFYGYGYPQNKIKAASLLQIAAEKDHCSEAAVFLGKVYLDGDGVIQSDSEAFKWFSLASKMGNTTGLYWEAFMYENSRGLSQQAVVSSESKTSNMMKADQLYRDAATGLGKVEQISPEALFALARIRDVSRPTYDQEVFQLLERSHELGNLDATNMLGEMYAEARVPGQSAEMSQRKAVELITEAAKKGHIRAQSNLGKLLIQGYGGTKSFADARIWLEKASKKFDPEAMFLLGYIIYMEAINGKNEKEMHRANMLFRHTLSINPSHDDALYYLADMLENGRGGAKDLVLAAENYKVCLEHNPNHSKALYKLGRIYLEGKGVIKSDKHLALEYMHASARLGNPSAMVYLGDLFTEDGVVSKDLSKAMQFYTDAARLGNAEAKMKQAELVRKAPYMFSSMGDPETLLRQAATRGYIAANV
jgi:TPR repeat protein